MYTYERLGYSVYSYTYMCMKNVLYIFFIVHYIVFGTVVTHYVDIRKGTDSYVGCY